MADAFLLQTFISIMRKDVPPSFFLNKQFDIYKWAQSLFQQIEEKRSSITAITREQAAQLGKDNLKFSNVKHESRINALYRLIGLPTELILDNNFELLDQNNNKITNKDNLKKVLLQREIENLQLTFKQFLQSNSLQDLNAQLDSAQASTQKLIAELFDPNKINTSRLFPIVQYSQIQNVVETKNRISPSFASNEERYVNEILTQPPFLESVITIRLLPQSGGKDINTQGAVEDIILQSLGFALAELAKQYNRNQTDAEKHLLDGITTIRNKVAGINSSALKAADTNANNRENDGITTEGDIRNKYTQDQIKLYEAVISLLPTENDIIPIGLNIDSTPFQSRNIKNNALTGAFLDIVNSNIDALQRSISDSKKILKKRQLKQDKLTAELGSIIGEIGGISLAEIIIIISALFVINENDLVGLISDSRFKQLISSADNQTSTSSSGISDSGKQTQSQKQINIFNTLKEFQNIRTSSTAAIKVLQNTIKSIYDEFVIQLGKSHIITKE